MKSAVKDNTAKIDELKNKPENRKCFDCHEKGTTCVVLDYGIFVCSACSGLHRELTHKVKGIAMSIFNDKDIEVLTKNGNEVAKKTLMASYNSKLYPEPDKKDIAKMKEFFQLKYKQRRFEARESDSDNDSDSSSDSDSKKKNSKKEDKKKKSKKEKKKKKSDSDSEEEPEEETKNGKAKEQTKMVSGGKLMAPPGKSSTKTTPQIGANHGSGSSGPAAQVDFLELGFEQPKPVQTQPATQTNDEQSWGTWATFEQPKPVQPVQQAHWDPFNQPHVTNPPTIQPQPPSIQQHHPHGQQPAGNLLPDLNSLFISPQPVQQQHHIPIPHIQPQVQPAPPKFVPGISTTTKTVEDPFSDLIFEQQKQQWMTQQQQKLAQQAQQQHHHQQQQPPVNHGHHQQAPLYPGGPQQQPVHQVPPNPTQLAQQQQLLQMQQTMSGMMANQVPGQQQSAQQMAMLQQMQQMMLMMQNMMAQQAPGGNVQAPPTQQNHHQEPMKKPNPQDNMFSDLFKNAQQAPQHPTHQHKDHNPFNPFGPSGSSPQQQQQPFTNSSASPFNPFGAAPTHQAPPPSSNNPFDMFN